VRHTGYLATGVALLAVVPLDLLAARSGPILDPLGTWTCLVYGDKVYGDERLLLRITAEGGASIARQSAAAVSQWAGVANWATADRSLTFADPRTGRRLTADLTRETLGGTWQNNDRSGGWWCRRIDDVAAESQAARRSPAEFFFPPLVPSVMATPSYPRQAIRDAKEGRAVVCFLVDSNGAVLEAEIVELSDEIFRDATMLAIFRSSYRPWGEGIVRPGCRSYTYELDPIF
jgi:TonB family protein